MRREIEPGAFRLTERGKHTAIARARHSKFGKVRLRSPPIVDHVELKTKLNSHFLRQSQVDPRLLRVRNR